jgi:hypothetical protein
VEKLKKVVEDLEGIITLCIDSKQPNHFIPAEKKGFEEKEQAEQDVINERKKELERIEQERLAKEVYRVFRILWALPSFPFLPVLFLPISVRHHQHPRVARTNRKSKRH